MKAFYRSREAPGKGGDRPARPVQGATSSAEHISLKLPFIERAHILVVSDLSAIADIRFLP
jgi:hypothetical protein